MITSAANRSFDQLLVRFAMPGFDSLGGSTWTTFEVGGFVLLAALLNLERFLRLGTRLIKAVIDFVRSEQVTWLRRQICKYRARKAAEHALRRAEQSVISLVCQHIVQSTFLYCFFWILAALWVVGVGLITINSDHAPQWKVIAWLIGLTLCIAVPAGFFREAGRRERRAARELWETCQARDLKTYALLLMTPLGLTALASTVVILRAIGGN